MKVYHFNTGRLYDEFGQRISYAVADADGQVIHFHDHSRMVDGTIIRKYTVRKPTPHVVMEFYDRGDYKHTKEASDMSWGDGVLAEFDDSGDNDVPLQI